MLEISYLSDEDRERLAVLMGRLAVVPSFEKHIYSEQIEEINTKKKLLKDCSFEEATKLKKQLYDKYKQLVGINKVDLVLQYQTIIMAVEQVISYKKEEFKNNEQARLKLKRDAAKQKLRDRKASHADTPANTTMNEWIIETDFSEF